MRTINRVAFVLALFEATVFCYTHIFILKHLNTLLPVRELAIGAIIASAISAIMIRVTMLECLRSFIKSSTLLINIICDVMWILSTLTLWIDPFVYLVSSSILRGGIVMVLTTAMRFLMNTAFHGDDKVVYETTQHQAGVLGAALGSILGILFSDISVYTAAIIMIVSSVILTPLMSWKIILVRRYIRNKK